MSRLKLFRLLLLFLLLILPFKSIPAEKVLQKDSLLLEKLEVPKATLDKLKKQSVFKYSEPSVTPGLFQRILMSVKEWYVFKAISDLSGWLFNGILLAAFVILIWVLFRSRFQGVFLRNPEEKGIVFTENEISGSIDFEALLKEALQGKNFNLAVRYWYLILLRKLDQKKMITYKPGKTNFEYISELGSKDLQPLFRTATRNYEYAWYGQFTLDESTYNEIASSYRNLTDKLND